MRKTQIWKEFAESFENTNYLTGVLRLVSEFASECFSAERVSIAIFCPREQHFVIHTLSPNIKQLTDGVVLSANNSMIFQVLCDAKPMIWSSVLKTESGADLEGTDLEDTRRVFKGRYHSCLVASIEWANQIIGTQNIGSKDADTFQPSDKSMVCSLAKYVGAVMGPREYEEALSNSELLKLVEGELELMNLIWTKGPLSIADAHSAFQHSIGYPTMQTRLNRLVKKDCLKKTADRPALYEAAISPETASEWYIRMLKNNLGNSGVFHIVKQLLDSNQTFSSDELDGLSDLIASARDSSIAK